MATLTQTGMTGAGPKTQTINTLTASDTFTYVQGAGQILILTNNTAGTLTPLIGSGAANFAAPGFPAVSVASYTGFGTIAIGAGRVINLDTIGAYLVNGAIALTAGTGLTAVILNPQL